MIVELRKLLFRGLQNTEQDQQCMVWLFSSKTYKVRERLLLLNYFTSQSCGAYSRFSWYSWLLILSRDLTPIFCAQIVLCQNTCKAQPLRACSQNNLRTKIFRQTAYVVVMICATSDVLIAESCILGSFELFL